MITVKSLESVLRGNVIYSRVAGYCLSQDEKPTNYLLNGSQLVEMDTGKVYFFDEENRRWLEFTGG